MKTIYTIGRGSECDIFISDDENIVSRRHATIRVTKNGKYYLSDQSMNGTYINGIRMRPGVEVPVKRDDTITFANVADLDWEMIPRSYRGIFIIVAAIVAVLLSLFVIVMVTVSLARNYNHEDDDTMITSTTTNDGARTLPSNPSDTASIKIPAAGLPDETMPTSAIKAKKPSSPSKIKNPKNESDGVINPII